MATCTRNNKDVDVETGAFLEASDLRQVYKEVYEIRAKWRGIGLELGLTPGTLSAIEQKYADPGDRLYQVLSEWLNGEQATWKDLISALDSTPVGETKLAASIQAYHCPQDPTVFSSQPERQNEDETEQFCFDISDVRIKYAQLLSRTRESLKRREVKLKELVAHLLGYRLTHAVLQNDMSLLADRQNDLEKADSIDTIFILMSPFWSFLDYEILEDIIRMFGSEKDESNLSEYVAYLRDFLTSWTVEPCTINDDAVISSGSRVKLYLKLDTDTLSDYRNIKAKIAKIFQVRVYTLGLFSISTGCIELVFALPKAVATDISVYMEAEIAAITPCLLEWHLELDDNMSRSMVKLKEDKRVYPEQRVLHQLDRINLIPGRDGYYHQHRDYYLKRVYHVRLQSGGFGTCTIGQDKSTLYQFVVRRSDVSDEMSFNSLRAESLLLSKLGTHDHVMRFFGAVMENSKVLNMFTELAECGNLAELLIVDHETGAKEPLYLDQSLYYIQQVLQGVNYLHQKGMLHLDINGTHVAMLNGGRTVKLTGFGSASEISEGYMNITMYNPYFASPEVVRQEQPEFSVDIWSVVCVLVELLTTRWPGCHRFQIPKESMTFLVGQYKDSDIEKMIPLSQMNLDPSVEQLFRWVFVADPSKRPSALTLLNHPRIMEAPEYAREFDYDGYDEEMSQETSDIQQAAPIPGLTPSQAPQHTPTQVGAAVDQAPSQSPQLHSSQNCANMEFEKEIPASMKSKRRDSYSSETKDLDALTKQATVLMKPIRSLQDAFTSKPKKIAIWQRTESQPSFKHCHSTFRLYRSYSAPALSYCGKEIRESKAEWPKLRRTLSMVYVDSGPEIDSPEREIRPSIEELISDVSGLTLTHTKSEHTVQVQGHDVSATTTCTNPSKQLTGTSSAHGQTVQLSVSKHVTVYETIC